MLESVFLMAVVLCGCSSGPAWKSQAYAFSPPRDPPGEKTPTNIVELRRVSIAPLFESRSFTYRTRDDAYEQDPYAGFSIAPDRAMAEAIRVWMRGGCAFGRMEESGSGLIPNLVTEVTINELYGDFRNSSQMLGTMQLHFVVYEMKDEVPGRVVLDKVCERASPMTQKTPDALMAAWDADLREITEEITSEYAKAVSDAPP